MADSRHGDDDDGGRGKDPPAGRRTGMSNAPTMRAQPAARAGRPSLLSLGAVRFGDEGAPERYEREALLGSGGMGEVHLARDRRIGRRVALKVLHAKEETGSDGRARFFREACVQGQLEHPVVVPVYDMDRSADGAEFFTMKRVSGVGLDEVLRGLREGDPEITARFSRHRLLTGFLQVCLGVDYAHARGVLHRDLKPANIMFGDFGEVYVLDWGLAKILEVEAQRPSLEGVPSDDAQTVEGQILGTPGYMAPEQLVGSTTLDRSADTYSLGAILFEILALEPLHGRGSVHDIIRSTHVGAEERAAALAAERDVPPELEQICTKATALKPEDRYASVRALHAAIEAFLEGNRDLMLRQQLALRQAETAREAAARAQQGGPDAGAERSRALRAAGRALALDPEDPTATEILAGLLLEPPDKAPPEAREEMNRAALQEARSFLLYTGIAFLGFFALPFTMLTSGIRSWMSFGFTVGPLAVATVGCFLLYWYAGRARPSQALLIGGLLTVVSLACVTVAATSGIYGPLFLSPLFAMALTALVSTLAYLRWHRIFVVLMGLAAVLVPTVLEWSGVIPPSYRFDGETITLLPHLKHFPETATRASLLGANMMAILLTSVVLWRFSDAAAAMRRRIQLHTWQLRQLVPETAHGE